MSRIASDDELADLLGEPGKALVPGTREYWKKRASKVQVGPARIGLPKYAANTKVSPARLNAILENIREYPVIEDVLRRVRLSTTSLKMWLAKSEDGEPGDGFDICLNPDDPEDDQQWLRFHDAYNEAMKQGVARVEVAYHKRAIGYEEVLTFQGRVVYQEDPDLLELGLTGWRAWKLDKNKNPIPESVTKQDPDAMLNILKARKRDVYGNKLDVDVMHRGGVLVVAAKAKTGEELNLVEEDYRAQAIDVEFEEVAQEDE